MLTVRDHISHALNPLHVYCRVLDCGLPRCLALRWCTAYERSLFRVVRLLLALTVYKPSNHRRKV